MPFSVIPSWFATPSKSQSNSDTCVFMSNDERIALETVILETVGPVRGLEWGSGDGDERTFHNYVHFPECMEGPFNFVFVDGRARNACARIAWKMLSDDGVLAVHDAQRQEYDAVRPADAWRIRLHDPRRQVDGGNVELHLFMRNSANE